jgi:uncharacterized membrane protein (UPF0127 family)
MRPWARLLPFLFSQLACQSKELPPNRPLAVFVMKQDNITVELEIADDDVERQRGLMFRHDLAGNAGMLFIFPNEDKHAFWMKDTYIPLDIIFITADLQVADVIANAEPLSLDIRSIDVPTRYAIEVNGGFAQRYNIVPQTQVRLVNVP